MWIDLNDEECADLIHQIKDSTGKPTGKKNIPSLLSIYIVRKYLTMPTYWRTLYAKLLTKATQTFDSSHMEYSHYQNKTQEKYHSSTQYIFIKYSNRSNYQYQRKRYRTSKETVRILLILFRILSYKKYIRSHVFIN